MANNQNLEKEIRILAIESSCDETAAAVVVNGRDVRSNVISSQIDLHTLYGGVVPEIASRKHIEKINQVIEEALVKAEMTLDDIDAIAVTYGPGLVGALLVGVAEAKAIAYAAKKPLVGVHHIEGHVSANFIEHPDLEPPFVCLIVSGGHTHLVIVKDYGEFEIIGRTMDDAAGEAFDKVARAVGQPHFVQHGLCVQRVFADLQRQFHVFQRRQVLHKVVKLEHKADVVAAVLNQRLAAQLADVTAGNKNFSLGAAVHAAENIEYRGFSGAGRADDHAEFTFFDDEIRTVQRGDLYFPALVDLFHIPEFYICHTF
jgi:glycoprotease/Kae1 family metallohydrolase